MNENKMNNNNENHNHDDDIYKDIYKNIEDNYMMTNIEILQKELDLVKIDNEKLRTELKEANEQIQYLNNDNSILKNNIVAMYNTALQEIERKNKKIAELTAVTIGRNIKKQQGFNI